MPPTPPQTFGKRTAPRPVARPLAVDPRHAAVLAAIRAEAAPDERSPRTVPRSFRAAMLAGLVVGACLAGLDATQAGETLRRLSGLAGGADTTRFLPMILALGLLGGARAAATNLLIAHEVLKRLEWTGHLAYAAGGAIVAAAVAGLMAALTANGWLDGAMLPGHGVPLDALAGAGAGFFYRVFAGARG